MNEQTDKSHASPLARRLPELTMRDVAWIVAGMALAFLVTTL